MYNVHCILLKNDDGWKRQFLFRGVDTRHPFHRGCPVIRWQTDFELSARRNCQRTYYLSKDYVTEQSMCQLPVYRVYYIINCYVNI